MIKKIVAGAIAAAGVIILSVIAIAVFIIGPSHNLEAGIAKSQIAASSNNAKQRAATDKEIAAEQAKALANQKPPQVNIKVAPNIYVSGSKTGTYASTSTNTSVCNPSRAFAGTNIRNWGWGDKNVNKFTYYGPQRKMTVPPGWNAEPVQTVNPGSIPDMVGPGHQILFVNDTKVVCFEK